MNNLDNRITTNQKIAVIFLLFFAVLVVFLWFIQFKKNFYTEEPVNNNISNISSQNQETDTTPDDKDTDGDGLSDSDELNFYKTSPYLEDSDSDGFSDLEEVTSNNDPNCPVGRICATEPVENDLGQEFLNNMEEMEDLTNSIVKPGSTELNTGSTEINNNDILSGDIDAQSLRAALTDAGFDSQVLDQISDEDLLKAYKDILNEQ